MLIEDHQVLHRDISWGNVLVNPTHVDEDEADDLCDRPFIDVVQNVQCVPWCLNGHKLLTYF